MKNWLFLLFFIALSLSGCGKDDFITLKGSFLFKADDLTKKEISSFKMIVGVMMHLENGESYFVKAGL